MSVADSIRATATKAVRSGLVPAFVDSSKKLHWAKIGMVTPVTVIDEIAHAGTPVLAAKDKALCSKPISRVDSSEESLLEATCKRCITSFELMLSYQMSQFCAACGAKHGGRWHQCPILSS